MSDERRISGTGLSTIAGDGTVLDAWFPAPQRGIPDSGEGAPDDGGLDVHTGSDERRAVTVEAVRVTVDLDEAPTSTADAYLRLHALSHRLVRPNEVNLDGIFGHLPTVAWTNAGPMHPTDTERLRPVLQRAGIQMQGLDKFPRLLDYVTPPGVRIADASRYASSGTFASTASDLPPGRRTIMSGRPSPACEVTDDCRSKST